MFRKVTVFFYRRTQNSSTIANHLHVCISHQPSTFLQKKKMRRITGENEDEEEKEEAEEKEAEDEKKLKE